jgi:hypothetical protein
MLEAMPSTRDMNDILDAMNDVARHQKVNRDKVRKVHKELARRGSLMMKKGIKRSPVMSRVRRKDGPDYNIARGSLRRSIKVIRHDWGVGYLIAPKSMAVQKFKRLVNPPGVVKTEGYYAPFIEEGDQRFGGTSSNKGFWRRNASTTIPKLQELMLDNHGRLIMELWK